MNTEAENKILIEQSNLDNLRGGKLQDINVTEFWKITLMGVPEPIKILNLP